MRLGSKRDLTIGLAMAGAILQERGRTFPIVGHADPIEPFYTTDGRGGWSGSFRGKRPAGMTKAARKKKRRAERLERQRRAEAAKHRSPT